MSVPETDYKPIPCASHERLEFAVLRRQKLQLQFLDAQRVVIDAIITPTDVFTREGAEWLDLTHTDGRTARVRLDHILRATPI